MSATSKYLRQVGLFPTRLVVGVLVVVSEIIRPAYRRLAGWISRLSFVERFSTFVGTLPRGVIFVLFAVPLSVADPLKVYAAEHERHAFLVKGQRTPDA